MQKKVVKQCFATMVKCFMKNAKSLSLTFLAFSMQFSFKKLASLKDYREFELYGGGKKASKKILNKLLV